MLRVQARLMQHVSDCRGYARLLGDIYAGEVIPGTGKDGSPVPQRPRVTTVLIRG